MSGGQQRMVSLGMALMASPKLLMLDEPSLGLAPAVVQQIFDAVRHLADTEGLAVLLLEQNVGQALRIVDRGLRHALGPGDPRRDRRADAGARVLLGSVLTPGRIPKHQQSAEERVMAEQISVGELLKDAPRNWGKWGADDEVGSLNYLTPEVVVARPARSSPARCSPCRSRWPTPRATRCGRAAPAPCARW